MLRFSAQEELNQLINRYYAGEAGLWDAIRQHIEAELRRREIRGAHHFRFRATDTGYDILVEDARDYVVGE